MESDGMEWPLLINTVEDLENNWKAKALLTARLLELGLPIPGWLLGDAWEAGGESKPEPVVFEQGWSNDQQN